MDRHTSKWNSSAQALADVLNIVGRTALFDPADTEDIQFAFEDLRQGNLEPSSRLERFYKTANPTEVSISPWIYDELRFVHIRDLADAHEGLAWKKNGKLNESWRGHWIIIATAGRDPYFVNASSPGMPVYTDTFGLGAWRPLLVASSLDSFLDLCALWTEVFIHAGVHPELAYYRERQDNMGLLKAERTWRRFRRELRERDPQAADSGFWSQKVH